MPTADVRISPTQLKAIRTLPDALGLARTLGYERPARPVNPAELGLTGLKDAYVIRSHGTMQRGYGVLVGSADSLPRSLRPLAKAVQNNVHDQPLAMLGVGNGTGWQRLVVMRPRQTGGQLGAVTVARLDVDLAHPTRHDSEVISALHWRTDLDEKRAQEEVSAALDVEAVTRRFYLGLRPHFERLERSVQQSGARNTARQEAIEQAGGARRVAIRILAQILFCYFLQRKRLLAGQREFLNQAWVGRSGPFYPTVLEPLFYDTLAVPLGARKVGGAAREIPFLNGGLFERRYGEVSLDLPDEIFDLDEGMLGYLNHWTFTVAEETADEIEVAVDPEMLGRIFESLLPDVERAQMGTYYTPRPVVQFMCREALIARLTAQELPENVLRQSLSEEDPLPPLTKEHGAKTVRQWMVRLDGALASVTVLDPAVGSGAFLLGMLGEIVRLRSQAHLALHGRPPTEEQIHAWKLHAIERSLFGVDIEPTAVELCRLRLWLSLVVELDASRPVSPLPNLDFRTICANSLVDFVEGVEIQDTRRHQAIMFDTLDAAEVVRLRATYFEAADPEKKATIRGELVREEDRLLGTWLSDKQKEWKRSSAVQARLEMLREQLLSADRVYPVFMPGFSAPDVWAEGGWDVVIMNPPYVGRKEIPQRWPELVQQLESHFGQTHDLMILFGERALQLARPGGVISMIFNDSIFTSVDADEFRRALFASTTVTAIARTKCFEGQAVNGGVIVARTGTAADAPVRWIEGYQRPVADFAAASAVVDGLPAGEAVAAGDMEVFVTPRDAYTTLPHRPLYRPSPPALMLRERFTHAAAWQDLSRWPTREQRIGWPLLSQTAALDRYIEQSRQIGLYERLEPGQWVLLGMVTEGGQGLATADDRRFLGAIEGSDAAEDHLQLQKRLERATLASGFAEEYRSLLRTHGDRERALLALWTSHGAKRPVPLPWPRTGTFRIVQPADVIDRSVTAEERRSGIAGGRHWVPFEKGDQSQELQDEQGRVSRIGAAWDRENPLVIDWSTEAVALLRRRAAGEESAQKPYFRNEDLWFNAGATWNSLASYLRARQVPEASIFGHMAPLIRPLPWIAWLSPHALLSMLNTDVLDFMLRTFLGSRMHIEVGDIRRLLVPVLSLEQKERLESFAAQAIAARREGNRDLIEVEHKLNRYVRDMYGVPRTAELWVVR